MTDTNFNKLSLNGIWLESCCKNDIWCIHLFVDSCSKNLAFYHEFEKYFDNIEDLNGFLISQIHSISTSDKTNIDNLSESINELQKLISLSYFI